MQIREALTTTIVMVAHQQSQPDTYASALLSQLEDRTVIDIIVGDVATVDVSREKGALSFYFTRTKQTIQLPPVETTLMTGNDSKLHMHDLIHGAVRACMTDLGDPQWHYVLATEVMKHADRLVAYGLIHVMNQTK